MSSSRMCSVETGCPTGYKIVRIPNPQCKGHPRAPEKRIKALAVQKASDELGGHAIKSDFAQADCAWQLSVSVGMMSISLRHGRALFYNLINRMRKS